MRDQAIALCGFAAGLCSWGFEKLWPEIPDEWSLAGFLVGAVLFIWGTIRLVHDWWLRRNHRLDRDAYKSETLPLQALVQDDVRMVAGKTFERCLLQGPVRLKPHDMNRFEFCSFEGPEREAFLVLPEGSAMPNDTVLLSRVLFTKCHFQGVVFVMTPDDYAVLRPGFEQLSAGDWRAKRGD